MSSDVLIHRMGQRFRGLLYSRNKDKTVQPLPDANISIQLLLFPGFLLYWGVPNTAVSLP